MFKGNKPLSDGATVAQHASAAGRIRAKLGGSEASEVVREPAPPFPHIVGYLWNWFVELDAGIDSSMGPPVITWVALKAWSEMTGVEPDPWECRALVQLGVARALATASKLEGNPDGGGNQD